jgi:hypothetical protein
MIALFLCQEIFGFAFFDLQKQLLLLGVCFFGFVGLANTKQSIQLDKTTG